ncbi:hypothetical protein QUA03_27375 [Microcoleus sp. S36b_A4]|uniref:hypothetical protein n=1 Tax=Microcoleus sp. S36b_A4 TaxID=3055420 RepID=UPI002FD43528
MAKPPMTSYRRIDQLKQLAYDCNLTDEEARQHGKLTATKTWEALLISHGLEFDCKITATNNTVASGNSSPMNPINFFEWVDLSQLLAYSLASAGVILLLMTLWPRSLNAVPRPVHFRIEFTISGDK